MCAASDYVLARPETIMNQIMRLTVILPRYVPSSYLRAELRPDTLVKTEKAAKNSARLYSH